jgi:hypothetical protein
MSQDTFIEGHAPQPPSRRRLLWITGAGLVVATAITVLFVLPAQFRVDPTGFGKASGLLRLAGPRTTTVAASPAAGPAAASAPARYYPAAFRSDRIDIPLTSAEVDPEASELEYKVRMKAGDSLVYSWSVSGIANPEEFYSDFHGETPAGPGNPTAKVVEYRQATGVASNGVLIAPMAGVHGWYLQNQSVKPVVVHLKLSGFYELVPPGEYGNTAGIKARPAGD